MRLFRKVSARPSSPPFTSNSHSEQVRSDSAEPSITTRTRISVGIQTEKIPQSCVRKSAPNRKFAPPFSAVNPQAFQAFAAVSPQSFRAFSGILSRLARTFSEFRSRGGRQTSAVSPCTARRTHATFPSTNRFSVAIRRATQPNSSARCPKSQVTHTQKGAPA